MSEKQNLDQAVNALNQVIIRLEGDGCNPLTLAAALMGTSFRIYARELQPDEYFKAMTILFSTATKYVDITPKTLH